MEWAVAKTGLMRTDATHVIGLGKLLAETTQSEIKITDEGTFFLLKSPKVPQDPDPEQCIRKLFQIPTVETLKSDNLLWESPSLALCKLDGILCVKFTSPGIRVVSVSDMLYKAQFNSSIIERSIVKATSAIEHWARHTTRIARRQSKWMDHLLSSYTMGEPTTPLPMIRRSGMISLPMTIEPAFGYSTRRIISDGRIADRTNVSFETTPYASMLMNLGAVHIMRACRIGGGLVTVCIPTPRSITVLPDTALPPLPPSSQPVEQALTRQWLERAHEQAIPGAHWTGLAYQIIQCQGQQQSISRSSGYLDYAWLDMIEQRVGRSITTFWRRLLSIEQKDCNFEIENLTDSLIHRSFVSWIKHLNGIGQQAYNNPQALLRRYHFSEVYEIAKTMSESTSSPLRAILEHKQGTRRFGHALRLLGKYNPARLRDLIDALSSVRQRDELIRVLFQAVQECTVASAKTRFIIIPDDNDFICLVDDIEKHGTQDIAGLLLILSVLHFSRINDNESDSDNLTLTDVAEGEV
jgi:hypothetical protein